MYNAEFEVLQHTRHRTAGGVKPLVVHFGFNKMFEVSTDDPRYQYMCWRPKQARLQAAAARKGKSRSEKAQDPARRDRTLR